MEALTRRQAMKSLALSAGAASLGRAMESGGFKAISVNHFEYASEDYAKIRDWYAELFGLTIAYDDGRQAYLWLGDTIFIPRKPSAGEKPPLIGHVGYTVETYEHLAVQAELKRRGIAEVSPNGGALRPPDPGRPASPIGNMNVHIKDPEGYVVQICSKDVIGQMVKSPADPNRKITGFKATGVNHVGYTAGNYAKLRDWYADLLGMKVTMDNGRNAYCRLGETVLVIGQARGGEKTPLVDRMTYTVENYNHAAVRAELKRRGIAELSATGGAVQPPDPNRPPSPLAGLNVHIHDPEGFPIEICSNRLMEMAEKNPPEL